MWRGARYSLNGDHSSKASLVNSFRLGGKSAAEANLYMETEHQNHVEEYNIASARTAGNYY